MELTTFKIVVTGPFGAGKTTFITSVSDTPVVATETAVSDETASLKTGTTVAMDYGSITLAPEPDELGGDDGGVELLIFGTPGQTRFDFMWRILAEGADAYLVLLDASRPESVQEAAEILQAFRALDDTRPFAIGATRLSGQPGERSAVALALDVAEDLIVALDVREPSQCTDLLLVLLEQVLYDTEHDDAPSFQ